ncbi:MAG: AraC family transcriptional regulator ligand-binding domain-containing protein, partial [Pseudomonadota bacterium]
NALSQAEPDRPFPLEAAKGAPFSTLGGIAHGMQYAATLREAIDFSRRNSGVLADRLDVRIIESAAEARVVAAHPNDALDHGCTAEMGTCLMIRLLREVMGLHDVVLRVHLSHAARGSVEAYERALRCPVRFSTGENASVVATESLDRPIRMGDPTMFAFIERHFDIVRRQIQTVRSGDRLRALQLAIYENAASGSYRTEDVLRRAGLSRRSAQRLAAAHGTTLAAQIEEARRSNAMAFLADRSVSVEMAASLLGYSDDRAFRRAFKRWTGQSPTAFRKSRQAS